MSLHCPVCGRPSPHEGMCRLHRRPFVPDPEPEPEPEASPAPAAAEDPEPGARPGSVAPKGRLALRMPWGQQINLPDERDLVLGRSTEHFHAHPNAVAAEQISRRHARVYRDEQGDLYVEDLTSANGTYLDGDRVTGTPRQLRAGQILRLALDVECTVLRLNEYGEPEGD